MPSYTFRNKQTGEIQDKFVSISARDQLVEQGEWEQIHTACPMTVTHVDGILSKTDDNWRDLLKTIKKNSGRGNTIKV